MPGKSLTLVRNPSWEPGSDRLRPAYPDRIEFTFIPWNLLGDAATGRDIAERIGSGALDVDLFATEQLDRYPTEQTRIDSEMGATYIPMNLAVPPFDDIHVRKAVALSVDRAGIAREMERSCGPMEMRWHIAPDAVEGGLLAIWRPDWWSSAGDDPQAARAEMALSRYDRNGDGRCDASVCRGIRALVQEWDPDFPWGFHWGRIEEALSRIGIELDATEVGFDQVQARMGDPLERWGIIIGFASGWSADFPNGSTFFAPLLAGSAVNPDYNINYSLLGATEDQLSDWGYAVTEVPSVDERIDRCMALTFSAQERCWADLDVYLMTEVVPWVPLADVTQAAVLSQRVVHYSYDQSNMLPAFEQIALAPGSE